MYLGACVRAWVRACVAAEESAGNAGRVCVCVCVCVCVRERESERERVCE